MIEPSRGTDHKTADLEGVLHRVTAVCSQKIGPTSEPVNRGAMVHLSLRHQGLASHQPRLTDQCSFTGSQWSWWWGRKVDQFRSPSIRDPMRQGQNSDYYGKLITGRGLAGIDKITTWMRFVVENQLPGTSRQPRFWFSALTRKRRLFFLNSFTGDVIGISRVEPSSCRSSAESAIKWRHRCGQLMRSKTGQFSQ